jgi:hypothetical protein
MRSKWEWHNNLMKINATKQGQNCPFQKKTVRLISKGRSAPLPKKWDMDRPKEQICPGEEKETFSLDSLLRPKCFNFF